MRGIYSKIMESDIKYEFEKIMTKLEDLRRLNLTEIKQKIEEINGREIKEALRDIKSRLENIESKIQK